MITPQEIGRLSALADQVREGRGALGHAIAAKKDTGALVARLLRLIAFSCRDALRTGNIIKFDGVPVYVDAETGIWIEVSAQRKVDSMGRAKDQYLDIGDAEAASVGVQRLAAGLQSSLLRQLRGGTVDRTTEIQAEADRMGAVVTLLEDVDH